MARETPLISYTNGEDYILSLIGEIWEYAEGGLVELKLSLLSGSHMDIYGIEMYLIKFMSGNCLLVVSGSGYPVNHVRFQFRGRWVIQKFVADFLNSGF